MLSILTGLSPIIGALVMLERRPRGLRSGLSSSLPAAFPFNFFRGRTRVAHSSDSTTDMTIVNKSIKIIMLFLTLLTIIIGPD